MTARQPLRAAFAIAFLPAKLKLALSHAIIAAAKFKSQAIDGQGVRGVQRCKLRCQRTSVALGEAGLLVAPCSASSLSGDSDLPTRRRTPGCCPQR
jgi:hypothetical protein